MLRANKQTSRITGAYDNIDLYMVEEMLFIFQTEEFCSNIHLLKYIVIHNNEAFHYANQM